MNQQPTPAAFDAWYDLQVRLADDDHYGHVNNARYYEYFDTAINGWLIDTMKLSIRDLPALGVVVASSCRFHHEIHFPDKLRIGIAVRRIGRSSIAYEPAIFRLEKDGTSVLCAGGEFVHVYIDPKSRRPVPIPEQVSTAITPLLIR